MSLVRQISQCMNLRKPQQEALEIFAELVSCLPTTKGFAIEEVLTALRSLSPNLTSFDRSFSNLCFALATGVGKTRLMGAMMTYLVLHKDVREFVVLAPNNTILEKLIREFSDPLGPKYVFRGAIEFANAVPRIITHSNFDEGFGVRNQWEQQPDFLSGDQVNINIFNIGMINSTNRRMKSPRETIVGGLSYFDYLAQLDKLVVFMDEAHRYRASASSKAIEDLNPLFGIELTATPQTERNGKSVRFNNVVYEYALSEALRDSFVKEPVVAGRENFQVDQFNDEELEKLKLEDGIRVHENTKLHLQNYAYGAGRQLIKPFVLVVAENIAHANQIENLIKNDSFFQGQYRHKVRVIHSKISNADDEDRLVKDLLEIEQPHNPIEIVIHVDKLREGWDVVNLYTIVPLRKFNSKTLLEQSLGRGLRLPYGTRTKVAEVDQLTIVSHDRFKEIIEVAKAPDSIIRKGLIIGKDLPLEGNKTIEARPIFLDRIANYPDSKAVVASATILAIDKFGSSNVEKVIESVREQLGSKTSDSNIETLTREIIEEHDELTIRIPRLWVEPEVVKPGRFLPFRLNVNTIRPQPITQAILKESLQDGSRRKLHAEAPIKLTEPPEHSIAKEILNLDEVCDTDDNLKIALDLANQMVSHLRSYLPSEQELENVIINQRAALVEQIRVQLNGYFEHPEYRFASSVGKDFTVLKSTCYTVPVDQQPLPFRESVQRKSQISSCLFTGFTKSCYSLAKFHSDSERVFACILEDDYFVKKWVRPLRGSLNLFYQRDHQYELDFVVETIDRLFLCEIKSSSDLNDPIVRKKADAAVYWCSEATKHAASNNGKPWTYLLIPHNEVELTTSFQGLVDRFSVQLNNNLK